MRTPPPHPRDYQRVPCPKCGVRAGQPCMSTSGSGKRAPLTHVRRRQDYFAAQKAGEPFTYTPGEPV